MLEKFDLFLELAAPSLVGRTLSLPGRSGSRVDLALAGLLVLLGCALFVYLSHALVTKL